MYICKVVTNYWDIYTHTIFMLEKILAALKTKYSNIGFGDKAFQGVAAFLATTVTEEDKIDEAVSGVEALLKSFQGDVDKRVSDAVAKAKKEAVKEPPKEDEKDKTKDPEKVESKKDDVPEWAKVLIESNKTLSEKLAKFEGENQSKTRKQLLNEKLEGVPDIFKNATLRGFGKMKFDSDDEFNEYLNEVAIDAENARKELSESGISSIGANASKGVKPGAITTKVKEATDEEIDQIFGKLN